MTALAKTKARSENDFSKFRALIVDDFENFRLSMRQMLWGLGLGHIDAVSNGAAAIQNCTYDQYDIVLCDYNLGTGKSGQHVLEELRHRKLLRRTSLFVMVTAETSKEMVMGAREYHPDGYLTKPINQAALSQRLHALFHQRSVLYPINREIDLENLPKAISLCTQLLPQQPRYKTWILKTMSDLYYQVGDYSHARKVCEDVLASREIAWARLGLGRVQIAERRYQEAAHTLQILVEHQPDLMEAYDLQAQALAAAGKPAAAQRTLETAAKLSPNAILRQRNLAIMATENQDLDVASAAWRKTVHLGMHSIHDDPEHYLNLGRSLSELSDDDHSEEGQAHAEEALRTLQAVKKRFPDAEEEHRQSILVQSRVHASQGRAKEAEQLVECIVTRVDEASMAPETVLELARTLFAIDHRNEAEKRLYTLSQRFPDDKELQRSIGSLLDEPVSFRKRVKARRLNRQGISAFESGDLNAAVKTFQEALSFVPKHAALNLNLVQVRLKQLEAQPQDQSMLDECKRSLENLRNLSPNNQQYRRYQSLQRKVESLS
ncbi:tetratricopeptide repeat-containing response regulator [Marinobacter fonticola]|uniref:tetratricopeptide repeat-containing response regulator n=1 Tax=Marinobacter fonticola TaxID=2603215 RepID=UPI0011E71697|nr:tetratricopeptide repeat-containing response regulator [Marinobacter fonticola]